MYCKVIKSTMIHKSYHKDFHELFHLTYTHISIFAPCFLGNNQPETPNFCGALGLGDEPAKRMKNKADDLLVI